MIKIIFENRKLLTELKIEQVEQRLYSERFEKICIQKGDDPKIVTLKIEESTPNDIDENDEANFMNWLISLYVNTNKSLEQIWGYFLEENVASDAEIFYQIKKQNLGHFLPVKDINRIKDLSEFIDVVSAANVKYQEHLQKKDYADASKGTNKIFENEEWEIYIPENKGAACALGKGTDWCTAAPGLKYYEQYHKQDDPLIIFISKHNPTEKYQFHYGTKQFTDSKDRDMPKEKLFFKLNSLIKLLKNKLPEYVIKQANKYKPEVSVLKRKRHI